MMTMILLPGGLFHQGDLLQYQDLLVLMVCLPILRVVYLFSPQDFIGGGRCRAIFLAGT
jgi:hypothetical protein